MTEIQEQTEQPAQTELPKRDLTESFNKLTEEQRRMLVTGFVMNRLALRSLIKGLDQVESQTTDAEQISAITFLRQAAAHQYQTMTEVIFDDTKGLLLFPDLPDLCEFAFTGKKPPATESGKEDGSEGDQPA